MYKLWQHFRRDNGKIYTIEGDWEQRCASLKFKGFDFKYPLTEIENAWDISKEEFKDMCGGHPELFTLIENKGKEMNASIKDKDVVQEVVEDLGAAILRTVLDKLNAMTPVEYNKLYKKTQVKYAHLDKDFDAKIDKMMEPYRGCDVGVGRTIDTMNEFIDRIMKYFRKVDVEIMDIFDSGPRHRFYFCEILSDRILEKYEKEYERRSRVKIDGVNK